MATYMLSQIKIHDREKYKGYVEGFDWDHFRGLGGECLIFDDTRDILEGEAVPGRVILLKFPNREALDIWYSSEEYKKIRSIRWESSQSNTTLHEEFEF
jgi:uncharacterized protein (DUF1330 family)